MVKAIPAQLKEKQRWVLWKSEMKNGHPTKIPICGKSGTLASVTNQDTWDAFSNAVIWYQTGGYAGIGFVLSDNDDILCIDLDNKNGDSSKLEEYKQLALKFGSYAEISPSGNGVHIWCLGTKPGKKCRRGDVEIYETGRYITITGHQIEGTPNRLENCQELINELYSQIEDREVELCEQISSEPPPDGRRPPRPLPAPTLTDHEIINLGCAEKNGMFMSLYNGSTVGHNSHSEADSALCFKIAFYTKDASQIDSIFRSSGLYRSDKWEREDYRERTINRALLCVTEQYDPKKNLFQKQRFQAEQFPDIDPDLEAEAEEIINSMQVFEVLERAFATLHSGNISVLRVIVLAFLLGYEVTNEGIQPGFSGDRGKGKTSSVQAALHLLPPEKVMRGSMTKKALQYSEQMQPGTIVFRDDVYIEDEELQMSKAAMSAFQTGIEHHTVEKIGGRNTGVVKSIPPRTIFIFTSIDDTGDVELADRQYKISLDPSERDIKNRADFYLKRLAGGREKHPVNHDILLCRQILRSLTSRIYRVSVPFASRMDFKSLTNQRAIEQFGAFIQAYTVINYKNRNSVECEGVLEISAHESDFRDAISLFSITDDIRDHKLTKQERALLDWLCDQHDATSHEGITMKEIVERYRVAGKKVSRSNAWRLMFGRDGKQGICGKDIPGIYSEKGSCGSSEGKRANADYFYVDVGLKSNLDTHRAFCSLQSTANEESIREQIKDDIDTPKGCD